MEQNNGEIFTNGRRSTLDLTPLKVWQNGSAVFFIHAPDSIQSLALHIGDEPIAAKYDPAKRAWRVYVQPLYLTVAGDKCYTVIAVDEYGNSSVLGSGTLTVKAAPVSVPAGTGGGTSGGGQTILPANAVAYNPQTGLYHRLVAVQDEAGVITVAVEQEGEAL